MFKFSYGIRSPLQSEGINSLKATGLYSMLTCECHSWPRVWPARTELMAHSHCSVKCHVEVLELWVKELKSRVKMRKSSPSTYILLAILQLAEYLYSVTHHATQTYFDFFAVIGILGDILPNVNSRKPTRHIYPVVITSLFILLIWAKFCHGASPVIQSAATSYL